MRTLSCSADWACAPAAASRKAPKTRLAPNATVNWVFMISTTWPAGYPPRLRLAGWTPKAVKFGLAERARRKRPLLLRSCHKQRRGSAADRATSDDGDRAPVLRITLLS